MIRSVEIKNFKSVVDLKLELGRFNILIGANGCGKSNILEAIAFGGAASADKLDYEFLGSRGIRLTQPEFMYSAFEDIEHPRFIGLNIIEDGAMELPMILKPAFNNPKFWVNTKKFLADPIEVYTKVKEAIGEDRKEILEDEKKIINDKIRDLTTRPLLSNYILFCPEQTSLRKFEDTNQIYPLGIKGEGLFQYLKDLSAQEGGKEVIEEIKENLAMLDWFDDVQIPENLFSNDYSLKIKDKYLKEALQFFDQRSTNEGFLYLLFYLTLFVSKDTPSFFAIDNLEASFNPKMCTALTKRLIELAEKHNKQVIVTTHNPAILDGLDIADDEQRLFVVSRNEGGHTRTKRIEHKEGRTKKLSEIWTSGYIGGLPDNF